MVLSGNVSSEPVHFPTSGRIRPNFAMIGRIRRSEFGNPCRQRDGKFCRLDLLNEVKASDRSGLLAPKERPVPVRRLRSVNCILRSSQ